MPFDWPRRRWAALIGLLLIAILAGLAWHFRPVTARPALWRISHGNRHAWLFGTIHAIPSGARWLSPAIEKAARESGILVLEATGLESERRDRRNFERLGRSSGLPPIAMRLPPADRPRLAALLRTAPETLRDLDRYESWAAALLIGTAGNSGMSSDEAGEAMFEQMFRAKARPVLGLETIEAQLGALDELPQADQDALLAEAVEEASAPAQVGQLYAHWAAGDLKALETETFRPLEQMPDLRAALFDRRNALWARRIDQLLRSNDNALFIAVGAGHLLGPGSVEERLAMLGWRVDRVQ
jgi:uncharacterized protein